mmetsp:Transcript_22670/g.65290  ORF Transcript_22670/g.65290 Transcript_22670/m.65290 type:complete len:80 (-) Transcript_22670:1697-1936(-)
MKIFDCRRRYGSNGKKEFKGLDPRPSPPTPSLTRFFAINAGVKIERDFLGLFEPVDSVLSSWDSDCKSAGSSRSSTLAT